MLKGFILQLQFLTRIPLPVKVEFDENSFAKGVIFSPVIGLIIGCIMGGVYFLISLTGKHTVAVLFAVLAEILITGGLHLDGLADTCDGIFSNRTKNEILNIMKDPRLGTSGALALILVIIFKIGILLSLNEKFIIMYFFVMPVISRMNIVWSAGISKYARKKKGMGSSIVDKTGITEICIATFIALIISAVFVKILSVLAIFISIIFTVLFIEYVKKRIHGITGDIIGAVIELSELIFLFTVLVYEIV